MKPGQLRTTQKGQRSNRRLVFQATAAVSVLICAAFLLAAMRGGALDLPRNALWELVHNVCVPGQLQNSNPTPCLKVDLNQGVERGFAILRDPRGGTQFLLVPTVPISGIESPMARDLTAANYFSMAWEVRATLDDTLRLKLPRDEVGMAINSGVSRSQDQLHIHFSCVRPDVFETLHKNQKAILSHWAAFNFPLYGQRYMAMWVPGENLSPHNPFQLLAAGLPNALSNMDQRTLVVIGFTRADGVPGFVILAGLANVPAGDFANGEELLDHSCQIATMGKKDAGGAAPTLSE